MLSKDEIVDCIFSTAERYGLDPHMCVAQCKQESKFNQDAVSRCGAIGLFQLMPGTAVELAVNPYDWQQNIDGGLRYMKRLIWRYREPAKALAAYNWGMGHMDTLVKEHPEDWKERLPVETRGYLRNILGLPLY